MNLKINKINTKNKNSVSQLIQQMKGDPVQQKGNLQIERSLCRFLILHNSDCFKTHGKKNSPVNQQER